jgi:hypothetical protein
MLDDPKVLKLHARSEANCSELPGACVSLWGLGLIGKLKTLVEKYHISHFLN